MVFQRVRRAVQAFRTEPRSSGRKVAPYAFPVFVNGQAHWQIDDFAAYVREGYDLNSVIYSAISYKARTIAKARLRAYRGDPENPERVEASHPLAQLVGRPNPFQSWLEFQQQRETYLNLAGNSYTWLDRPRRDVLPTALYNLRPDRVWIVPGTRDVKGFFYIPEGATREAGVPMLPQDVEHVKFPNPADPLEGLGYGLSPMASLAQSADVDNVVTAYIKLLFEQGGVPSGIIKTKVPLQPNDITRIKDRWREQYGGFRNWADIGVLDTDSDYQRLGMTFKELGFDTLDARNESRMLGPFGVPPMLIFTRYGMERGTFNNYEQAREACWEDTLLPELELFQADDEYSLRGDDGTFVRYDTSDIPALQKKVTPLVDAAYKLWTMGTPRNQALAAVGLRMADAPGGDTAYVPVSFVPAGGTAPPPSAPDNSGDDPSATDDNRDGGAAPPKAAHFSKSAGYWSVEDKARLWKAADSLAVKHEPAFRDAAGEQFSLDQREVLALVSDMKRKSLQRKASIQWELMLDDVHDVLTAAGDRWREAFTPLIAGVVEDAGKHWQAEAGLAFDVPNLEAEAWFEQYTLTFSTPIQATSEREIAAILQQGQRDGWSVPQMQKCLEQLFEQWISGNVASADFAGERLPPWRTETITRTETIRSYGAGSLQIYKDNQVAEKEWLSTLDDRTRDSHLEANGQVVAVDEPFSVGGSDMQYPGDPDAPLDEFINCRCSLLPVLED